jgi:hypothetical protein
VPTSISPSVEHLQQAIDSMRSVREQLRATERAYRRGIARLEAGAGVGDALEAIAAPATRMTLNDALADLEHSRHQARLTVVVTALGEGLSLGEIGRKIGVSRQLAARLAKEARAEGTQEDADSA